MQEFQQRVVDEKKELDVKLDALVKFFETPIFSGLPNDEQDRLAKQAEYMGKYSEILKDRIAAF